MKFLLIGFFGRTYMPYMEAYEHILKAEGAHYDVVCFERYATEPVKIRFMDRGAEYTYSHVTAASAASKLLPALRYFRYVRNLIQRNAYDRLIVFTTMPAVFLADVLLWHYDKRYVFDYRDYTYEKHTLFSRFAATVMKHAYLVCFSSRGYLTYYPGIQKFILTHNISNMDRRESTACNLLAKDRICIGFLGYIRYFDVNRRMVDSFANHARYKLKYIGSAFSDCDLQGYCEARHIQNVEFHGMYQNSEKPLLYREIDIINSVYSLASPEVKQAIPNRIYDAALYKKPVLVAKGTHLAEIVERYGLGIAVNPMKESILDAVQAYLRVFDERLFTSNCERFLEDVSVDVQRFQQEITRFVRGQSA